MCRYVADSPEKLFGPSLSRSQSALKFATDCNALATEKMRHLADAQQVHLDYYWQQPQCHRRNNRLSSLAV
jgi:hypothetical protein